MVRLRDAFWNGQSSDNYVSGLQTSAYGRRSALPILRSGRVQNYRPKRIGSNSQAYSKRRALMVQTRVLRDVRILGTHRDRNNYSGVRFLP